MTHVLRLRRSGGGRPWLVLFPSLFLLGWCVRVLTSALGLKTTDSQMEATALALGPGCVLQYGSRK